MAPDAANTALATGAAHSSAGKYARFELERRLLVSVLPARVDLGVGWRVSDRYIRGTRLRLRRLEPLEGGDPLLKLGQKEVVSAPDFSRMRMTTMYLTAEEHGVLAALPADELHKRRHYVDHGGHRYSVDVFDDVLRGLVLAEAELTDADDRPRPLPDWAARDVSHDVRFTGGALAALDAAAATEFVRGISTEFGVAPQQRR